MIDVIGRLETVDTFSKVIFNGVIIIKEASPKSEYLTIDPIINVLSPDRLSKAITATLLKQYTPPETWIGFLSIDVGCRLDFLDDNLLMPVRGKK